jgi:aspartyl-tRNA(Asn)/glutamyl-tRNA(Gln) amidotransferase subunit A
LDSYNSLSDIQSAFITGDLTCSELLKQYLQKISASKSNAFIEVYSESALKSAQEIDEKIKSGTAKKLAGLIIGVKDNICIKNKPLTASSKILENFNSVYNSTAVERLLNEDAIIIGRLNCDEFAMGSSNENSIYGPVLNPHDLTKVPGGSSGGSAAAVAEGLCLASLGSDTGGSIRQPASFCGVVGLKPSYGRVSRHGLIAYGSSFDQIGPLTNNIDDAAIIMEVIAGQDDYDSTSSNEPVPEYSNSLKSPPKSLTIAIPSEYLNSNAIDNEIKEDFKNKIAQLKELGHKVKEVSFPYVDSLIPTYYVLTTAEASSNLARYDGAHYGYRSENSKDIETTYFKTRSEGFGLEVKRRIMLGTFVLSAGYYDAYYTKALRVRRLIKDKTDELFKDHDLILLPTAPTTAFGLDEIKDPIKMYLQDIFTVHANIAGNPAISIPLGNHTNNMPFGIQLMTNKFEEEKLLACASYMMNELN